MPVLEELRSLVLAACPQPGVHATAIQGVTLIHADAPSLPIPLLYTPRLCVGIEGTKELALGDRVFQYGPGEELIASVALPVTGRVATVPYLAFAMELDVVEIAELHLELPPADEPAPGLITGPASRELVDAVTRAVRMLHHPHELPTLGPLVRREILFRALTGPRGALLRRLALDHGHAAGIARTIAHLRTHFAEPFAVERLARDAAMSVTSFHRHFKAVTSMSPLQFQKQLRLQEARHLLLAEATDVASVSLRVGYESTTQFTREYARLFGAPPRRDAERLRAAITPS